MWVCCRWLGEKLGAAVIVGETGHGEGVNVSLSGVESMRCFIIMYALLLAENCLVMRLLQQGGALDGFLAEIMRSRASSVCYLYKYLERRPGGHAGWRKKQWLFKCYFAKGLYRSCLLNDPTASPVLFAIKYSNVAAVCCRLFPKLYLSSSYHVCCPTGESFSSLFCGVPLICPSARQERSIWLDNGGKPGMIHRDNETNNHLRSHSSL